MSLRTSVSLVLLTASLLVAPVVASNGGPSLPFDDVQFGLARANGDELVSNDADIHLYYNYAAAAANCQFLVAVNTFIVNVAAVDQLGVFSPDFPRAYEAQGGLVGPKEYRTATGPNATASCEEDFGTVRVIVTPSDGFGAPSPLGGGWGEWLYNGDADLQAGIARAQLESVVSNDVDIDIEYNVAGAAANCQFLAAANTVVINAALTFQDADFTGGEPPANGIETAGGKTAEYGNGGTETNATATCTISVDRFELIVGDPDHVPPGS